MKFFLTYFNILNIIFLYSIILQFEHMLKDVIGRNEDFKLDWHDPDEATDGYQLKWVGKDYARLLTGRETETVIIPDNEHNEREENKTSENLFFTGDNLDVLKHLQNAYSNSIKMIYIDPPYNTGKSDFVYPDNFAFSDTQLKDTLGLTDEEIKRLHTINGKSSHSAWLTFMYPRLRVAWKLLTDDGVIFISIDDNEQANLKLLCDEIFGEDNFVTEIAVNRPSEIAQANTISKHEYLLCYSKDIDFFRVDGISKYTISRGTIGNEDQTMPKICFPKGLPCYNLKDGVYAETRKISGSSENVYNETPIIIKNGKLDKDVELVAKWRSSNDMRNFFKNNCKPTNAKISGIIEEIYFENDKFNPQIKKKTYEKIPSIINDNKRGSADLEDVGMQNCFSFPKSVDYIEKLIKYFNFKEHDIIMDFFAGSSTTAHSVLQYNIDSPNNVNYIMVQIDDNLDKLVEKSSNLEKNALQNAIKFLDTIKRPHLNSELGQERIKRISKKLKEKYNADIDYGFKHYYVKEANVETVSKILEYNPESKFIGSDDMVREFDNDKSKGEDVILRTWLTDDGYKFDVQPEIIDFKGYKAYYVDNSTLYLISQDWNTEQTKELLNKIGNHEFNLNSIIIYGYSFNMESVKELEINIRHNLDKIITIEKRY